MNRLFAILHLVLISHAIEACIFKAKEMSAKEKKVSGPWNDMSVARNTTDACECGINFESGSPPWNLYIHIKKGKIEPFQKIICIGTIITSNLVATSHDCVRLPEKKLNVYDAWNISSEYKNFVKKTDIKIRTSVDPSEQGEVFKVEEIIPNPNHLLNSIAEKYPELDLLLLKVNADFTSHKDLSPICIPEDVNGLDFIGQLGQYYGVETEENNLSPIVHEGIIFTKKICDSDGDKDFHEREKNDEVSPLCLRWDNQLGLLPPARFISNHAKKIFKNSTRNDVNKDISGPLFLKSHQNISFLAGIACNATTRLTFATADYAYFANIIPMIKYLEYRAHQHHSKWCKTPTLDFPDKSINAEGRIGSWPWEKASIQESIKVRDESLNCVCGIPNTELQGRIVGGKEAEEYEFGWMVYIMVHQDGRGRGASICGGSIINDRMILTAAHCVVSRSKLKGKQSSPQNIVTNPENVDVTIKVHKVGERDTDGLGKKVQSVLVHPDYAPARKRGYFDYDIAILVLKDTLDFPELPEPGIRPVCLPKTGETIKTLDEMALVAGWGLTHPEGNKGADKLQKIELPIMDLQKCRDVAQSRVTDHFLCAGSLNKMKDSASGDSGGPLNIKRGGRQWIEVGLVSWAGNGYINGEQKTAALYTDITNPVITPFIDYFAKRLDVKWCKSNISN